MGNTIIEYLKKTEEKYPYKTAFIEGNRRITFKELFDLSKKAAAFFIEKGVFKEPVILNIKSKIDTVILFISIIESGNFYIPIDNNLSFEMKKEIIKKSKARIMVTSFEKEKKRVSFENLKECVEIFDINDILNSKFLIKGTLEKIQPEDTMYVIYTSGSVSEPKGVEVAHNSVISYIKELTKVLKVNENTIFGCQSPLFYDAPIKEIYGTIFKGATTVFIPKQYFSYPTKLIDLMNEEKINMICWVSSSLSIMEMLDAFKEKKPCYLRTIAFGSENLSIKTLNYWRKHFNAARFLNLYGPTECTGMSTYYELKDDFKSDIIPIGKPFSDTKVWILNEDFEEVKKGEIGEIYIGGKGVAKGYFKNNKKTNEVFLKNIYGLRTDKSCTACYDKIDKPDNEKLYTGRIYKTGDIGKIDSKGNIVFLGRKDNEIKYMGHKISLEEIDRIACMIPSITRAGSVYDKDKNTLMLIFDGDLDEIEVKTILLRKLPKYMIPKRIIKSSDIPMRTNGKIDRRELLKRYAKHV